MLFMYFYICTCHFESDSFHSSTLPHLLFFVYAPLRKQREVVSKLALV